MRRTDQIAGAVLVAGLLTLTTACNGGPSSARVPVGRAQPTASATNELTPLVDALSDDVAKLTADDSMLTAGQALTTASDKVPPAMAEVRAALKAVYVYHKANPKSCSGLQAKSDAVVAAAATASAAAKASQTSAAGLQTASVKLGKALAPVQADLDSLRERMSTVVAVPGDMQRIEVYSTALQGLAGSQTSSVQTAKDADTAAEVALSGAAKQIAAGKKVVQVCLDQAAARDAAKQRAKDRAKAAQKAAQKAAAIAALKARQKADDKITK